MTPRPPRAERERLDVMLVDRGLASTRARARALILAGRVRCGTDRLTKPGQRYPIDVELTVDRGRRWVGRGAYKLDAGLREFAVDLRDRDCLDVGASTGGFTEVMLLRGAHRVIALDVGRGQLDWRLRRDDRVSVIEGVNARRLRADDLPFAPTFAAIDVSFISIGLVLPAIVAALDRARAGEIVALVKPQFEVGRKRVGRGGIVRDPVLHDEVLRRTIDLAERAGCGATGLVASPIAGAEGNREFLLHLERGRPSLDTAALDRAVEAALVFPLRAEDEG
ncbi:MAG TPA: TlyA family RNA methyltransferase [Candidatus Polarisedimenticolaceae bacterium]|nr:TlyA family RNA methyltransferase [Candidatus Polarisedimenticolaceae bacterium]